jgi:hypothetical protein
MAYKFQIGAAQMSGALVQEGAASVTSLDANSGGITEAGAISGATTVSGSGLSTAGSLASGQGNFTVSAVGVLVAGASTLDSLNNSNGGITNAGAISQVTTISGSGLSTAGSLASGQGNFTVSAVGVLVAAASTVDSLDVNSGGITEAGAISGATTVSGSGLASSGQLNSGQGNFTVSAAGDVVAAAAATIGGVLTANANVSLGNAVADVTTIASQLTASAGAFISGQVGLVVGAGGEFQVDNSGDISTSGDYSGSLVLFEEAQSGGILRGNFNPAIDNVYNLGASDKRWGSVYAETFIGNIGFDTYTYTANATIAAAVDFAIANGAGGAFQLDLPAGSDGKVVRIKRKGSNNITLSASVAGNTIADESNGQLIVLEADGAAVTCIFSGSAASGDWYII